MKTEMQAVLKYLQSAGAEYADIRLVDTLVEQIETENQKVKNIANSRSRGVGVRVIYDGSLGFASSQDTVDLEKTAAKALEIAKASRELQKTAITYSKKEVFEDHYVTPIKIDPFKVPLEHKVDYLIKCERAMATSAELSKTEGIMIFQLQDKVYADSEGSFITQTLYESGGGIKAYATHEGDTQVRSYPNSFEGDFGTGGYEYVEDLDMLNYAAQISIQAYNLVRAEECPKGVYDVLIDSDQMQLQIHESIGHPLELDRIYGSELAFAGGSFVTESMVKEGFKYGSEHVTVVSDALTSGALGTYGYDDDGVKAMSVTLIDKGILKDVITSRDTASVFGSVSNGANRADGWQNLPIVRMNNISLLPGDFELFELIGGIEDGLYLKTNKSWSIDDMRVNFQFATEIAYEIKNGKLTGKIFKNPVYSGITPEFWASCDGVANKNYWKVFGTPNCGKGQPMQVAHVAHGSSPARFRNVKVGV
ncbi:MULTISPECIES: TldD/PmbA family protein [unclassified Fusibacter]|uniref:TldD/PmbA family protein n=1 Tax=unclassified Fusibacter TaxID=2624464 RepID=UPI0013E94B22|nr:MULTISPECIES: TldD/PmbA family protein [unclassified Fusibacter]MCK8059777.1 TldD/PmbA family protein [Fusibacter sp. A2]NPE21578.1 TldD/PmbA family protein [Fusibacter sp. A1]